MPHVKNILNCILTSFLKDTIKRFKISLKRVLLLTRHALIKGDLNAQNPT